MVMVVTIIGIIASIAVPRISGAAAASRSNALEATLANVRKAIDVYYAEHGRYPGYDPANGAPDGTKFVDQLLLYSDEGGRTNATPSPPYIYGPYLRAPFPRNPTNNLQTVYVKATPAAADPAEGSVGWVAVLSHGYFAISASATVLETVGVKDVQLKDVLRGVGTAISGT